MLKKTLEQDFELVKLRLTVRDMTDQEIIEQLIDTIKSLMMTDNQFSRIDELTLSQQFELHRMQQAQLSRPEASLLLINARNQLMIKRNVLSRFKREMGWT